MRYFVAVADEGNFTRAAARLAITQSGLSAAISALESSLGARLLDRHTRRAELTHVGREFYRAAKRVLDAANMAAEAVHGSGTRLRGSLRMGCTAAFGGFDLAGVMGRYTARHPEIAVDVRIAPGYELLTGVREGSLHLAFVTAPIRAVHDVQIRPLGTHPVILACPAAHRLATRDAVALDELTDEHFVDFSVGTAGRASNDAAFDQLGLHRAIRLTCDDVTTLLEFVSHGIGIALVPRPLAQTSRVPVQTIPIRGGLLSWTIGLAMLPGGTEHAPARALVDLLEANTTF